MPAALQPFAPVHTEAPALPAFSTAADAIAAYSGDDHIYALYPSKIKAAARRFVGRFPGRILFAVKSNPHPEMLKILWEEGVDTFDVASIREMELVSGLFPGAKMYLMHPIKSRATIARAYSLGIRDFSFDHEDELQKIYDCTGEAGDLNLHLRLSLPSGGAVMPLSGKFGAEFDAAVALLKSARPRVKSLGICFHVGSQCLSPGAYDRAISYGRTIVDASGVDIDSVDIGGGFPVAYPDMPVRPMDEYFDAIRSSLIANEFGAVEIIGEPGRALCAEGGATLARIELRKGHDLYLNDGTYGSLFDAGQFAWKFPVTLHRRRPPAPSQFLTGFRFFGPTCDSADTMNGPFPLPSDACEGDWIEIQNLGAYGQTLATQFNGFYSTHTVVITDETL